MARGHKAAVRHRRAAVRRRKRKWPRVLAVLVLVGGGALAWLIWPYWQLSGQFGTEPVMQPSRLYGVPATPHDDPPLIASYYGPDLRERRPVALDELPEEVTLAILAAEDAYFLEHSGFSLVGTLRAAWVNLRARKVRQGGSTLTQQLVKNLYLTQRRTLMRKLQEVVLAVFLEQRYPKHEILQTYLNEIYWGRSGSVDLMGIGAAAWAYFGKHPSRLDLAESALLAGIIRSPASLSPLVDPVAARERRNFVLGRLAQLEWLARDRLETASRRPVPTRQPLVARRAPYFAAAAEAEARRRFGIDELADAGYVRQSTLSLSDQTHAEQAVRQEIATLEEKWRQDREAGAPLEAALISVDPATGGIRAYVGGRNFARSQFDRVALARRQAGSAFKPIVYATAFADGKANPTTLLNDAPFSKWSGGREWKPRNSDGKYRGLISARAALEQSLNVPTARLALDVGLERIVDTARRMGITGRLDPYPALALGAMEVSPLEMASVYATLAAGGLRPELHGLTSVADRFGAEVAGRPLASPERVLSEDVAWMVNEVLQGVLDRGTAKSVRRQGFEDPVAGKTGTTNNRRDSWFAGYSPERMSLVWVGYDDNSKTLLSGARAALPIWLSFTTSVRPVAGYAGFDRPAHGGGPDRSPEQPGASDEKEEEHPFRGWLDMLKRKNKQRSG